MKLEIKVIRILNDLMMYALVSFLFGTGLLIHYRLVPGYKNGHGLTLLGMNRHEWGDYHLWASYALLALVVIHLKINFTFIKNAIAKRRLWRLFVIGLIGPTIILLFLVMPIAH